MNKGSFHIASFVFVAAFMVNAPSQFLLAQTKTYLLIGQADINYHNKNNEGMPDIPRLYYGIEVDKYLNYNYALTTGAFYMEGGYDNGLSRLFNKFVQVPVGIKMASLGSNLGIVAGVNFNYLLNSRLTEICDTLANYHSQDVTKAMKKIQPDLFWGLLIRLNRVTVQIKFSHAITNRFSTDVQKITDQNPCYYGSYYAYVIGKEEKKMKAMTSYFTLSVRLF